MDPATCLQTAAAHLDDALENLTFERFDWAIDDAWRAIAWMVAAAATEPEEPILPAKGVLPASGTLREQAASGRQSSDLTALIEQIEDLRAALPDTWASDDGLPQFGAPTSRLVLDACRVLDGCGEAVGIGDRTVGFGGIVPVLRPRSTCDTGGMARRDALKLLAAGGALSLAACARAEPVPDRPATASAPAQPAIPSAQVRATTALEGLNWPTSEPFLFCAHHVDEYPAGNDAMGPAVSLEGRVLGRDFDEQSAWRMYHGEAIPGFPRHPHRGFETVTVVRTGMLDHADSMGATARYGGGDVQWLTAGGGIQHAEMFPLLRSDRDNPLELFQIWLNLPARDKMVPAHFTMLWNEQIPRVTVRDDAGRNTEVTVVAGRYGEARPPTPPPNSWASRPESDLAIWKLRLDPGARFEMPAVNAGTERSLYLHVGAGGRIGEETVANMTRVELDGNGPIVIEAGNAETEILLLQARPIGEPIARRGPFVMNTQDEIHQAYADYRRTQFGGWPWPDSAPVHDRTRGRFALRPDGTLEEPS